MQQTGVKPAKDRLEETVGVSKTMSWHCDELYDSDKGSITIVRQKRVAAQ